MKQIYEIGAKLYLSNHWQEFKKVDGFKIKSVHLKRKKGTWIELKSVEPMKQRAKIFHDSYLSDSGLSLVINRKEKKMSDIIKKSWSLPRK